MVAVVQVGSAQYRVSKGDTIETQRLDEKEGVEINLDKVLLFSDGTKVKIGTPFIKEVNVTAQVLRHHLAKKVISFKYRRRKNSLWKKGHRQQLTTLSITKISSQ